MRVTAQQWSAARPLTAGFLTLTLLVGGVGGWSVLTRLSGAVIVPGQMEVSLNQQVVQHLEGGQVQDVLVEEGMEVTAGDLLMRLEGSALSSELAIITNQLFDLGARRARLEAQSIAADRLQFSSDLLSAAASIPDGAETLAGQMSLFVSQVEMVAQAQEQRQTQVRQIESQIEGIVSQQQAVRELVRLLDSDLSTQRDLFTKGLTQSARVSELERELAQLKGREGELTSASAEAAGRITEIRIGIAAFLTLQKEEAESELRDVAASQLEMIERSRALVERMLRLEIRSPVSGIILGLKVTTPQAVIRPAEALMSIVPQDQPLLVAARVPVAHVDEVHTGQDVRLVFSSLLSRLTPEVSGKIALVSADAITDERTAVSYYRAEVSIDAAALQQLGDVAVVPGMPVDVFIQTGERTPLSFLLRPFTDYFRHAFKET